MSTTKIWPVRDNLKRSADYVKNPAKTEYDDLRNALHYAKDENKTVSQNEKMCFVTGIYCDAENAYEEMMTVKNHFGKTGGNVAYHAYQSFPPGEVTPELCHKIGVSLAKELWGENFQVVVATHLDREHLHNHFLINSVSYRNGKKFNDDKRMYFRMREASDNLCREYGLSVIENPGGKTPRNIYFAEKRGEPTKFNLIREAIDRALKTTATPEDFKTVLKEAGYIITDNPNRKYATIQRIGEKQAVRLYRLGKGYDLPEIKEKLMQNTRYYGNKLYYKAKKFELKDFQPAKKYNAKNLEHARKVKGLKCFYLVYMFHLNGGRSKQKPLSPEMREECRKMDRYAEDIRLIATQNLSTLDDVKKLITEHEAMLKKLERERKNCYNRLRRCGDPETIEEIKAERDKLTSAMAGCRKEIKIANRVITNSERMHENLKKELKLRSEKNQRDTEFKKLIRKRERSWER